MKKAPTQTGGATYDGTYRLVNKKTGKLASSTNWLLDLAAVAKSRGDSTGLPALLPQKKADKFLRHNDLERFKRQQKKNVAAGQETTQKDLRELARSAYPVLVIYYIEKVIHSHNPNQVNRKGFRAWLIKELNTINGGLNRHLMSIEALLPLVELKRSDDWWRIHLKIESKSEIKT